MECRKGCAACCIEASISQAIPGMPEGKPGGVRCVNLDEHGLCTIWNSPDYPSACRNFTPTPEFCGSSNEEAMTILRAFDKATTPDNK